MGQSGKFRLLDSGKFQLGGGFNATDGKFSVDSDCCCPACLGCATTTSLQAVASFAVPADSDCFDNDKNPPTATTFCHDYLGGQNGDYDSHYEDSDMCSWWAGGESFYLHLVYWKATKKMYAAAHYDDNPPNGAPLYQWNSDAYFASGATQPGDYYGDPTNTSGDGEQYLKFMMDITGDIHCSDTNWGGLFVGLFELNGGLAYGEADDGANCFLCTLTYTLS